eukprot:292416-Alexandrium_andersonii.AAC.1
MQALLQMLKHVRSPDGTGQAGRRVKQQGQSWSSSALHSGTCSCANMLSWSLRRNAPRAQEWRM